MLSVMSMACDSILDENYSRNRSLTYSILLLEQSKTASFRLVMTGVLKTFSSSCSFNSEMQASLN